MGLTREQVEHIAMLARLQLDDQQIEQYRQELDPILTHVERLNELDTEDVEPTAHVVPLSNVFREDEHRPSLSVEDVLANAPESLENGFMVPRVVEEG